MIDPNFYTTQHIELEVYELDIDEGLKDCILATLERYEVLKAKLAEIERQKPIARGYKNSQTGTCSELFWLGDIPEGETYLYASPIQQSPAVAVNDWEAEAKRAFWAGLEIGACFGSVSILPRWNEYIAKRKGEICVIDKQGA